MRKAISLSLLFVAALLAENDPVPDESLRRAALTAVFPSMQMSPIPGRTVDSKWKPTNLKRNALTFPDALSAEKVYRVTGKPASEVEQCAAGGPLTVRDVRFQLYPWPAAKSPGTDWLAIVQYGFAGASPNSMCPSILLLVHLTRTGSEWRVRERVQIEAHAHKAIQGIRFLDLTGDGKPELILESDLGEEEAQASELHVFDMAQGAFNELLDIASRMSASVMDAEQYLQTLDIPRTVKLQGKQFCFTKTTFAEEGKWFAFPRSTKECYKRGRGVEKK